MIEKNQNESTPKIIRLIEQVPDPRIDRCKRHPLVSVIFIALVATLSGADDWVEVSEIGKMLEDWFKRYVPLPNGIPSHDTFGRVFGLIEPTAFNKLLINWADQLRQRTDKEVIAFDGKTLCGTKNKNAGLAGLHILNAWSVDNGISLGQLAVDKKTNEIKVTPELIKMFELEGCIVTTDALNTQKKIASAVIEANADYILPVKENHKDLLEDIQVIFEDAEKNDYKGVDGEEKQTVDFNHGRSEVREYFLLDADELPNRSEWVNLQTIGKVIRTRTQGDKTTREVAYFISSLDMDISVFARGVRGHWGVENGLHWSLDVIFREDESRYRDRAGAANLSAIRKMSLGMLKQDQSTKAGIRTRRLKALASANYRESIIENYLGSS